MRISIHAVVAGVLFSVAAPSVAHAQPTSDKAAQRAFDEGMALMKQRKLAEACPRFEESQRLDPAMGTAFRLAECYEGIGKLAKAWALFGTVAAEAKAKNNRQRETYARKRVEALEPKLGRMSVVVSAKLAGTAGLAITRDGEPVPPSAWGAPDRVDPGEHVVRATAPGKKPWETRTAALQSGTSLDVIVPALDDEQTAVGPVAVPPEQQPAARRSVVPAVVLGSAAGIGVGLGVAGMILAASKRGAAGDLQASLNNDRSACAGASPPSSCTQLKSAWSTAATFQNLAIWSFVGAGVATAGTLTYVLWPAPKDKPATAIHVVPTAGPGGSGVLVSGTF